MPWAFSSRATSHGDGGAQVSSLSDTGMMRRDPVEPRSSAALRGEIQVGVNPTASNRPPASFCFIALLRRPWLRKRGGFRI